MGNTNSHNISNVKTEPVVAQCQVNIPIMKSEPIQIVHASVNMDSYMNPASDISASDISASDTYSDTDIITDGTYRASGVSLNSTTGSAKVEIDWNPKNKFVEVDIDNLDSYFQPESYYAESSVQQMGGD